MCLVIKSVSCHHSRHRVETALSKYIFGITPEEKDNFANELGSKSKLRGDD